MDPVAQFITEHVVYEPMLSEPGHALKRGRCHDRIEVMAVTRYVGDRAGNPGLDPRFQLIWSRGHTH